MNMMVNATPAHVVVLGNEKGGSGKSTTAMHLVVSLLKMGYRVGSIDLDVRQKTLTRYIENRADSIKAGLDLTMPDHHVITRSKARSLDEAEIDERARFEEPFNHLLQTCQFIVIDSPGSDSYLSRLGHAVADTIITPLNDSFIDLDLLARVDGDNHTVKGLSLYSEMIWESRKRRAMRDRGEIDWIVMRNRVAHLDAHNKRRVEGVLEQLSKRIGFRLAPGLGERVIYRELFLKGLTLLDLRETGGLTMSHLAARQELRNLVAALNLPQLNTAMDAEDASLVLAEGAPELTAAE